MVLLLIRSRALKSRSELKAIIDALQSRSDLEANALIPRGICLELHYYYEFGARL